MKGFELGNVHPSVTIGDNVSFGKNVTIGMNSIIFDNVSIGSNTIIGTNCLIGEPLSTYYKINNQNYYNPLLQIGDNCIIRSGSILYSGSIIGEYFESGHRVTIRESTFIGNHCKIGTLSDIQGDCSIGNYVRLHSNVHIGQKSKIGNFVWIFPYTVLTNDPNPPSNELSGVVIEDYAVITTKVVVLPGVHIGKDALIGASSLVRSNVPPESIVVGVPGKVIGNIKEIRSKTTGEKIYPWREYFERGMPWEGIGYQSWSKGLSE